MLIKSPLWILNSALAAFCLFIIFFILIIRKPVPQRKSLRYALDNVGHSKDDTHVDLARIYENDLFNTYNKEVPTIVETPKALVFPAPPQAVPITTQPQQRPQFLEPLPVALKGVIYTLREQDNRAIIADGQSKQETLYKTGDVVHDAELIHIGRNNVIFIRSNGQQESLFLTPQDAHDDPQFKEDDEWTPTIKKLNDSLYTIDSKSFAERINNLAQFIDMLDLTTAFEKGQSIGCRVGNIDTNSMGTTLGLMPNDIVTLINGISPTSTKERVSIYNNIKNSKPGDAITVQFKRAGNSITHTYRLIATAKQKSDSLPLDTQIIPDTVIKEKPAQKQEPAINLMAHSNRLESAIQKNKNQTKLAMKQYGGRNAVLQKVLS